MYQGQVSVTSQEQFNKEIVKALTAMYLRSLPSDLADQHDIEVRGHLANLDSYAFRHEYAEKGVDSIPCLIQPPPPA